MNSGMMIRADDDHILAAVLASSTEPVQVMTVAKLVSVFFLWIP